jgi:sulfur-carrier protein
MAKLFFTQQLARFTVAPELETSATNLRAALEAAFSLNPALRSYILDEQDDVRQHVVIFVDGCRLHDHKNLTQSITQHSSIHVLQALSGG